ncbi:MAG: GNAT family N-acetyltransferase [Bacteroidales bacterium]|nr:GNAT family N-acetyltransferase [Bacteroidales bacterium]
MNSINVREARPGEAEHIIGFQVEMARETENMVLEHTVVSAGVQAVFADPAKGKYYFAESGNQIAACMLTTYEWSDWRNGTFIWLQSVYVKPEFRGKGVFRSMYRHIKELVSASESLKGIRLYVFHTNENAQAVYRSLEMEDQHYRMFEWVKS